MFARKAILPVDVEMEKEEASDALLNVYPNLQVVQYTISLFSFCTSVMFVSADTVFDVKQREHILQEAKKNIICA